MVVTPVFEDAESCSRLFRELAGVLGPDVYVIAVDDGSVRHPLGTEPLAEAGLAGTVLRLRRNVGHQRAIAIGLAHAREHMPGEHPVVVMDCDGEDLPSTIPALLDKLSPEDTDVVVAQRLARRENAAFKAFYFIYRLVFRLLTGRAISFGNFMALKPRAVQRLTAMQELSVHVAGSVLASKLRTATCPLDRGTRYAGQSRMNFTGFALHGFKALMVFAEDVLVRVGTACAVIAAFSVTGAVTAVILKLLGFSTPGWFSVALGILVLIFLQTGVLTLMTLMLTGIVRGGMVASAIDYGDFVEEILETTPRAQERDRVSG